MNSDCPNSLELSRFHDRQMNAGERERVNLHLLLCADCTSELDVLRALSQQINDGSIQIKAPATLVHRLQSYAERLDQMTFARFVRRLTLAAAASFLLAAVYVLVVQNATGRANSGLAS